ncbi:dynein regulatory complex subunit 4-like [Eucyclogobius newberryi]|uniref:dynein regulatory complex subunit 4-like n=1 Tax=Eucyclogobius newberryi TaxID=166745 RepID=UPI003B5C66FD
MPPKKGKKAEKKKKPVLIDGLSKDDLTVEQIGDRIQHMQEVLDREREESNYFRLERDKVHDFWDITEKQLNEAKAELKNLDIEQHKTEIKLQLELKMYRYKMRYLLCEYQNTIGELEADSVASKKTFKAEQTILENRLKNDLASLLVNIHQTDIETPIMDLMKRHQEEMNHIREISEKKLRDAETKTETKIDGLQLHLANKRKTEVCLVRDNWTVFIVTLMAKDTAIYEEAKAFLQTIEDKFDVLMELEQTVEKESLNLKKIEKELAQVLKEKHQTTKNLTKIQEDVALIQSKPEAAHFVCELVSLAADQNQKLSEGIRSDASRAQSERPALPQPPGARCCELERCHFNNRVRNQSPPPATPRGSSSSPEV